jgi:hypothetical protein
MNEIYKKNEEGLNFMNLLISGGGTLLLSYYLIIVDFKIFIFVIPFLILLIISFILNLKEYFRLKNE